MPQTRVLRTLLAGLTLWLALAPTAPCRAARLQAEGTEQTFWIDTMRVDISKPGVVSQILALPADRLIVSCFDGGHTLYPTTSRVFAQMPKYVGKADVMAALLKTAKSRGVPVYAFVDCLHWKRPEASDAEDIFVKHPELADRSFEGNCGMAADGKYASAFDARVRTLLVDLMQEMAKRYPDLTGVVLRCRYPLGTVLGYSGAARLAFIKTNQIDPIDLSLTGGGEDMRFTREWVEWRYQTMSALVASMSAAFRSQNKQGKVAAVGYANWYRLSAGRRNTTLEDWLNWAVAGSIDEIILETEWQQPANKNSYVQAKDLVSRTAKPARLGMLLPFPTADGEPAPLPDPHPGDLVYLLDDEAALAQGFHESQQAPTSPK